jgi:hypothetical protein
MHHLIALLIKFVKLHFDPENYLIEGLAGWVLRKTWGRLVSGIEYAFCVCLLIWSIPQILRETMRLACFAVSVVAFLSVLLTIVGGVCALSLGNKGSSALRTA